MSRTTCTESQCLYKGALYLFFTAILSEDCHSEVASYSNVSLLLLRAVVFNVRLCLQPAVMFATCGYVCNAHSHRVSTATEFLF